MSLHSWGTKTQQLLSVCMWASSEITPSRRTPVTCQVSLKPSQADFQNPSHRVQTWHTLREPRGERLQIKSNTTWAPRCFNRFRKRRLVFQKVWWLDVYRLQAHERQKQELFSNLNNNEKVPGTWNWSFSNLLQSEKYSQTSVQIY